MDFEDIANALWVGVIVVVAVLSGKRKKISGSGRTPKPSGNFDADKVRKLVRATGRLVKTVKHQGSNNTQPSQSRRSRSDIPLSPAKRTFSAYKHLPKQTVTEESVPDVAVCLTEPKNLAVLGSVSPIQRGVTDKKTKLREWLIGQVILDVPAFKKNYGNFFNR